MQLRNGGSLKHAVFCQSILFAAAITPIAAQGTGQARGTSAPNAALLYNKGIKDEYHPSNYVCITEQTSMGREYPVFQSDSGCNRVGTRDTSRQTPSAEIDRRSQIIVRFNRQNLLKLGILEGSVGIEASILKPTGAHPPTPVPGYSEIGEKARISTVTFRDNRELRSTFHELYLLSSPLIGRILDTRTRVATRLNAFSIQNSEKAKQLAASADTLRIRLAKKEQDAAVAKHVVDSLRAVASLAGPDSTIKVRIVDTTQLVALRVQAADMRVDLANLETERSKLPIESNSLVDFQSEARDSIRATIALSLPSFTYLIQRLATPKDPTDMDLVADRLHRDGGLLRVESANLVNTILPRFSPSSTTRITEDDVNTVLTALRKFALMDGDLSGPVSDSLKLDAIGDLRDTRIDVLQSGAEVGDQILITITYRADSGDLGRQLQLRMPVREFGLVQRTSDSFLFLNRSIAPVQSDASTTQPPASIPYRFVPTAGVTFGWSLQTRRQWLGGGFGSTLLRWLSPGFGINVSFPQFDTQITAVRDTTIGNVTSKVIESSSSAGKTFDLGVGVALSLFDNAVQVTWGRAVTASQDRNYFGIGFSFIRIAEKVKAVTTN